MTRPIVGDKVRKDKSHRLRIAIDEGVIIYLFTIHYFIVLNCKNQRINKQSTERDGHKFKTCLDFLMSTFEHSCGDGERSSLDEIELAQQQLRGPSKECCSRHVLPRH